MGSLRYIGLGFLSVKAKELFQDYSFFFRLFFLCCLLEYSVSLNMILSFANRPPLFLGITTLIISKLKGSKLIFNDSDLWPESAEKLDINYNKLFLGLSYQLGVLLYRSSTLLVGQTKGIVSNINNRFSQIIVFFIIVVQRVI
jgi:hypothetical protein